MFLISCALYACRAVYISSIIHFSFVRLTLDIISNMLLESVSTCTGLCCLRTNSYYLRIASASSNRSAKAITSADNTERATRPDLYDFYETGIALWLSSVKRNMCLSCDDKSAL